MCVGRPWGGILGWYARGPLTHTPAALSLSHTLYIKVKKNVERIITTFLVWVSKLDPTKDNETALSFAVPNHDWKNLKAHQMIDTR